MNESTYSCLRARSPKQYSPAVKGEKPGAIKLFWPLNRDRDRMEGWCHVDGLLSKLPGITVMPFSCKQSQGREICSGDPLCFGLGAAKGGNTAAKQ
jgi:hypothetical protein